MDDPLKDLGSKLRGWYNRSPKIQQAYEKLSADVDAVHAKMTSAVEESPALRDIRDKVAAAIDPPAQVAAPPEAAAETAGEPVASPDATAEAAQAAMPTHSAPEAPSGPPVRAEATPDSTLQTPTQGSPLP
jgi:hypothetical protein